MLVYIGVGSNIDPERNIRAGLRLLLWNVEIVGISLFYCTEAIGNSEAPPFYNGVIAISTQMTARQLKFDVLRTIEDSLGRVRSKDKYAPRPIDFDIILYGDQVICETGLEVPDPDVMTRPFVAVPLFELDHDLVLPGSGIRLADIVRSMDAGSLKPLEEFTSVLRQEMSNEYRKSGAADSGTAG